MKKLTEWLDNHFLKWAILFLLLFIPLYPKLPLLDVTQTWVYVRLDDVLVMFVVGVFLFVQFHKRWSGFRTQLSVPIFLYWGIGLLSLIFSIVVLRRMIPHFFPHLAILHYARRLEYMVVFFLAASTIRSIRDLTHVLIVFSLGVLFVNLYAVGQKLGEVPAFLTMNEEFAKGLPLYLSPTSRITSTFGGHYDLAAYLGIAITIFASLILSKTTIWVKLLLLTLSALSLIVLLFTASRVSLVVLLVSLVVVVWWHNKKKWLLPCLIGLLLFLPFAGRISERFAKTFRVRTVLYDSRWGSPVGVAVVSSDGQVTIEESASPAVENLPIGSGFIRVPTHPSVPVVSSFIVNAVRGADWYPKEEQRTLTAGEELQMALERGHVYFSTVGPVATSSGDVISVNNRFSLERAIVYDISFTTRLQGQWPRAWEALRRNVLLGSGYSVLSLAADSDYMRALGETGILGFAAFFYIFIAFFLFTRWMKVDGSSLGGAVTIGMSAATVGLLLTAASVDIFEASKVAYVFWMLLGFTIGGLAISYNKKFSLWPETKKVLRHPLLFIGLLALVSSLVFGGRKAYFLADDFTWLAWAREAMLTDIPRFFTDSAGFFYRPMSKLYYFATFSLFWFNPQGYASVNILLHAVSAALLYLIVRESTKKTILAIVVSLLFVILAVHHENVAWISGLSSLAGSTSALASLYLCFLFLRKKGLYPLWLVVSFVFMALALLWYEGMLAMPLAILAALVCFGRKKQWWLAIPFLFLVPGYWWLRSVAQAVPPSGNYGIRLSMLAFNVIGNTIGYMSLTILGPYTADVFTALRTFGREHRVLSLFASLLLVGVGIWQLRRFRSVKLSKATCFWLALFVISLIPYLGLGNMSERYAYFASAALTVFGVLAVSYGWSALYAKYGNRGRLALVLVAAAVVINNWIQLNRSLEEWRGSGKLIDNLLVSVRKKFFPIQESAAIIFVDVPFRAGRAWVFPVGFADAISHALQSKTLRVFTVGSVEEARTLQASLRGVVYAVQVKGDELYEISGK